MMPSPLRFALRWLEHYGFHSDAASAAYRAVWRIAHIEHRPAWDRGTRHR